MLCPDFVKVNRNNDRGHVARLECKRWACEHCAPKNRWKVIKKGMLGTPNAFITLTCKPDQYRTYDEAARDMKRAFVALRKALAREKGITKLPFIAVFEKTKLGWPHLHLLVRAPWIDQRWLSDTWKRLCGAFVVDIRKVQDNGRAARYVSKYLGKDPHGFEGCKRYWRSRDYNNREEEPRPQTQFFGLQWERCDVRIGDYLASLASQGAWIEERNGLFYFETKRFRGT